MILLVKHVRIEGPGLIGEYFRGKGHKLRTVELEKGERIPMDLRRVEAVIMLGGPMNVYEEEQYPYLKEEDILIKKILDEEMPFLGLCLGSQLLAKAAGAKVMKAAEEEIGFYRVTLTPEGEEDPVFRGVGKNLDVFQWHGDTFDIPPYGTLLAVSDRCRNQALRVGNKAYGFQFHLEVDGKAIAEWSREYFDGEDTALKQKAVSMIAHYASVKDRLKSDLDSICRNFEALIAAS